MGLPTNQLGPHERIVIESREHVKHLLKAGLICLAAIIGLVLVLQYAPNDGFFQWLDTLGWVAFAGVVVIFGVWPWAKWSKRTSTLTNERLVTREGVFRRTGRDIPEIHEFSKTMNELVRVARGEGTRTDN